MTVPQPRPAMQQAIYATVINCAIGAIITGTLFIGDLISLWENRKTVSFRTAHTRWRLSLGACAMFSFIVFALDGALVWRSWKGDETGCAAITVPHVLFYFFEKQSVSRWIYAM